MFEKIFSWVYSKDFTFWQNVSQLAVIVVLVLTILWSIAK